MAAIPSASASEWVSKAVQLLDAHASRAHEEQWTSDLSSCSDDLWWRVWRTRTVTAHSQSWSDQLKKFHANRWLQMSPDRLDALGASTTIMGPTYIAAAINQTATVFPDDPRLIPLVIHLLSRLSHLHPAQCVTVLKSLWPSLTATTRQPSTLLDRMWASLSDPALQQNLITTAILKKNMSWVAAVLSSDVDGPNHPVPKAPAAVVHKWLFDAIAAPSKTVVRSLLPHITTTDPDVWHTLVCASLDPGRKEGSKSIFRLLWSKYTPTPNSWELVNLAARMSDADLLSDVLSRVSPVHSSVRVLQLVCASTNRSYTIPSCWVVASRACPSSTVAAACVDVLEKASEASLDQVIPEASWPLWSDIFKKITDTDLMILAPYAESAHFRSLCTDPVIHARLQKLVLGLHVGEPSKTGFSKKM